MKFKYFVNGCLIVVAITFLVALAFRVTAGATADSVAVLKTTGMTCGSCSSKITQALNSQKGVAITEVDVAGGWVIVGYEKKTVDPYELAQRVSNTGFGSNVHMVLSPDQFNKITGRHIGKMAVPGSGCCGSNGGGCGPGNKI